MDSDRIKFLNTCKISKVVPLIYSEEFNWEEFYELIEDLRHLDNLTPTQIQTFQAISDLNVNE